MKILVTGGAGFIGSHLAEKLCRDGHEVTVLDSLSDFLYSKDLKIKNTIEFNALGIKFHHLDMALDDIDQVIEGHDVIINQAAIPGLVMSWSHLDEYSRSNIVGLGKILEAAKKHKVKRFIQISTSSVYGKTATRSEDSSKNPFSPYGVTKLAAENLARAYESNYELPVVILRYFSVYGPRQRPDMAYNKFISKISQGDTLEVYGDGNQTRTNTYVGDIVNATATCTDLKLLIDGLDFNVSGSEKVSLLQVIEILENQIGKKAKLSFLKKRDGDQVATEGDFSKANRLLGYTPSVSIEKGLQNQIEWQLG